jgi:hypothetical protein
MAEALDDLTLDPPELPEAELEDDRDEDGGQAVASSQWSFAEETRRLKARKALDDAD